MIVKKYTAPTEKEAVLKAKEELGAGAVVLNVKTIKQRGIARLFKKDYVEITAALEEKDVIQNSFDNKYAEARQNEHMSMSPQTEKSIEKKLDTLHTLLTDQIKKSEEDKRVEEQLKGQLKEQNVENTREQQIKPEENNNIKYLKLIYNKLIDSEVEEKLANVIIEDIDSSLKKEANIDNIISAVYQKIILKLGEPEVISEDKEKSIIFFMGPTGVGKTTTIAKLASEFKLNKGRKVAMITADTYRIAAVEQLNTYAGILDVPVSVIFSPSELVNAVKEYSEYDMIFVDTAGRSHRNLEQLGEIEEMFKNIDEAQLGLHVEKYLVLSATTKYRDLLNIADAYKDIKNYRLLFTKLDETGAYGNLLNMRINTGAPLSYTTCGQNVPDDIEITDVQGLAKQLISGAVN